MTKIMAELATRPDVCPEGLLDLRGLPAPEPLERALLAAASLRAGESLVVRTPRIPTLLLTRLHERGLRFAVESIADGSALVYVEHP